MRIAALPRLRDGNPGAQDLHGSISRSSLRHHEIHDPRQRSWHLVLPREDDEGGEGGAGAGALPAAEQGCRAARRIGGVCFEGQGVCACISIEYVSCVSVGAWPCACVVRVYECVCVCLWLRVC